MAKPDKMDRTLDELLVKQIQMLDPEKRAEAEVRKLNVLEKLQLLQNLVQDQTSGFAQKSMTEWTQTLIDVHKKFLSLPKKQQKKNRAFLAQVQKTSVSVARGWDIVSDGRAKRAAKGVGQ